jgi:hypothetical protein
METEDHTRVVVTDIRMPFWSMVTFMRWRNYFTGRRPQEPAARFENACQRPHGML